MSATAHNTQFEDEVLQSSLPVLVDFWAPWCEPCRMMSPVVDNVASRFTGLARIVRVNVDELPQVARDYGIASVPCFLIFRDGEVKSRHAGALPEHILVRLLEDQLV